MIRFSPARLALALVLATLAACSDDDKDPFYDPYAGRSAAEIYAEGEALLNAGDEMQAAQAFEELERVHPYSEWSKRAMIMAAFSYYQAGEFDSAVG